MDTVGSFEAKTHLPALLDRVAKGEKITITKRGVPFAMLVPLDSSKKCDRDEVIDQLQAFGQGRKRKGIRVRELIEEGRRF
jgi:prevent-host-death family protein